MKKIVIDTARPSPPQAKILMIYTGGTLGMIYDETGSHLIPFDFEHIEQSIPELRRLSIEITVVSTRELIDSANIKIETWLEIDRIIRTHATDFDGFVILHGTDTMAFTASAMSYFFADLYKPIILTGAQLPIGEARNDARINLITSLEIAAAKRVDGFPQVPEVCIYFDYFLWRGCRATKVESSQFNAFASPNYPHLAEAGIDIHYRHKFVRSIQDVYLTKDLNLKPLMSDRVGIVKLYPSMPLAWLDRILGEDMIDAIVLETYGSGTVTTAPKFLEILKRAIDDGIMILNITQCQSGSVTQGLYETSQYLNDIGVIGGKDMTTEAAVTKLMYLLGNGLKGEELGEALITSIAGELTI